MAEENHQPLADIDLGNADDTGGFDISMDPAGPTEPNIQSDPIETADIDTAIVRENALNIKGVDELSTADVKSIMQSLIPDKPFRIEWIDDHSLNLAFPSEEYSFEALKLLAGDSLLNIDNKQGKLTVRDVHMNTGTVDEKFTAVALFVRYATTDDVKSRGAKDRSRYYLFYGEPDVEKEGQSRLSDAYRQYLNKISDNDDTRRRLERSTWKSLQLEKEYWEKGDLFPDIGKREEVIIKQEQQPDLFPGQFDERESTRKPPVKLDNDDDDSEDLLDALARDREKNRERERLRERGTDSGYERMRSWQKGSRSRSASPGKNDLASRIDTGKKGGRRNRNRKNRKKAIDMF